MVTIIPGTSLSIMERDETLKRMFEFRHMIFKEKLGWNVKSFNRLEIDEFDNENATYIVAHETNGSILGCWRLLPTSKQYMLKDVFSVLLRGEKIPQADDIWEMSRFAVHSPGRGTASQAKLNAVATEMFRAAINFSDQRGITQYVTVTSVSLEHLLTSSGIRLRRFGDGRSCRIGSALSVACWIDIDGELRRAVKLLS